MWKILGAGLLASTSHRPKSSDLHPGDYLPSLPEYSLSDIKSHNTRESVWITYKQGVYDITKFVKDHPGGDKILLAAGSSADQYFNIYRIHHKNMVYSLLEGMRIGNLKKGEAVSALADVYKNDPRRPDNFIEHSKAPCNFETPPDLLKESFITPNAQFFIRNHLPVPIIDPAEYRLEVILDDVCYQFTLDELKEFKSQSVVSAIQCAGNRRTDLSRIGEVRGVNWQVGAIGNAEWTGVSLREILHKIGVTDSRRYKHVHVEGYDADPNGPFGTSVPIEKALEADTLLAFKMNNEDLPRDHGFPVRLIVPGYIGKRSIKWVKRITLSKEESPLMWHRRDYRHFGQTDSLLNVDYAGRKPVYEMPVQSSILSPLDSTSHNGEEISAMGYSYSGGGRDIVRVELTTDCGETWIEATLLPKAHKWGWTLWEAKVPVSDQTEVCVKATDESGNTQPERPEHVWNFRGLLNNAWHCVKVFSKQSFKIKWRQVI